MSLHILVKLSHFESGSRQDMEYCGQRGIRELLDFRSREVQRSNNKYEEVPKSAGVRLFRLGFWVDSCNLHFC